MRQGNRWDGSLGGNNFRLKRGEGSYRKLIRRSEGIPFQEATENRGQFNTRGDTRTMHQTSWVDGALWNKPLISASSIRAYYTSNAFDLTSVPGDLKPLDGRAESTAQIGEGWHGGAAVAVGANIYAAGQGDPTQNTVRQWNGSSWSTFTNNFPINEQAVVTMFHDANQATLVAMVADGNLDYVNVADDGNGSILDIGTVYEGANAFMHFGRMFVYTGDLLREITDPYGSPAATTIQDDGMGPDFLSDISTSAAVNDRLLYMPRLAVATAEGVYYVKNVEQEGLPTAFIYRVDRTNDGTDIGNPVATLPPGMVALDVGYHLGSLLVSCTDDVNLVINNDVSDAVYPRIDIYHLTNGSLGAVGSPLGGDSPDEAPFRFCGNFGAKVYVGGQKRVWEYDAVSGGLHPLFEHDRSGALGAVTMRAFSTKNSNGRAMRFIDSEFAYQDIELGSGVTTGDPSPQLESTYFDFNIPAEQKTITHVTLMTDGMQTGETWTVALATDDSAFADVASYTSSDSNTEKKRLSAVKTGFRFRYRLTYSVSQTVASPSAVKGIVFHGLQGEMVTQWALRVDGTEFRNVENTPQRPEDVLTWLESQAADATVISFVDEYKDTSSTHNVKVESVTVERSAPQEIDSAQIVLTEDT